MDLDRIPFITWLCELPINRLPITYDLRSLGIDVSSDLLYQVNSCRQDCLYKICRSVLMKMAWGHLFKNFKKWWYSLKQVKAFQIEHALVAGPGSKVGLFRGRPWKALTSLKVYACQVLDVSISQTQQLFSQWILDVKLTQVSTNQVRFTWSYFGHGLTLTIYWPFPSPFRPIPIGHTSNFSQVVMVHMIS